MMAEIQTIESENLSLGKLFDDFYIVPDYQREYVWEDREVEQLIYDIHAEFSSSDGHGASEYFIGSIVVYSRPDQVFELIDGQQRMTTTYLFLCALRNYLFSGKFQQILSLDSQIAASDIDAEGNDIYRYRVELQYEDSGNILQILAKGDPDLDLSQKTRSKENIINAYKLLKSFIHREYGNDIQNLRKFYSFFSRNVKLIRIKTQSIAHALKIFETINDRGKGLDSMDLLKNLMFMNARQAEFDKLKNKWKSLVDILYQAGEKPLRFLRYFIFASYDVDRLKEDEIYNWFITNESKCGYRSKPLELVEELLNAAKAYSNFLNGKDNEGDSNRFLENIRYLSGAARQHLILLLAARKLSQELFSELCRHVENLFFTYIITRENTREFERNFAQWTDDLRKVKTQKDLDAFFQEKFVPVKNNLSQRFELAFKELDTNAIQQYRLRYILGRLTQFVNERAFGSSGAEINLSTFINKKIQIEHILPKHTNQDVLDEFDKPDSIKVYIPRFGNLTLTEEPLNTSLGSKPFSEKKKIYPHSKFLLTQLVVKRPKIGQNTAVDRAVAGFKTFDTWISTSIEERQEMLGELAKQVWEI
jgi:uncharacterized protein with ParB-like and HNH nuclease domain